MAAGIVLLIAAAVGLAAGIQQVFLVPHSHCDAGWLLTADQYFNYTWPPTPPAHTGAGGSVHRALDTITEVLAANSSLRFVWSETIWFYKWWRLQTPATQAIFRGLVDNGQIEFVGGGWVQNDETLIPYFDVVDQVTCGHEFLKKTLNFTVERGWQLDMFTGYTGVTPSLWALMGYSEMVLRWAGPQYLRDQYELNKKFEFVWQASKSLPVNDSQIFAHIINGNYGDLMGAGFDWEQPAWKANPSINASTVAARAQLFAEFVASSECSVYLGPCMLLWGTDFHFHNAQAQFGNMTYLVDYINANPETYGLNVQFSTAKNYFDALYATNLTFPLLEGMDFEYGWPHVAGNYNGTVTYQTGATTSWQSYKQYVRFAAGLARAAESFFVLGNLRGKNSDADMQNNGTATAALLDVVRQFRALVQHHDSIPGTMRTNVSCNTSFWIGNDDVLTDYWNHVDAAVDAASEVLASAMEKLCTENPGEPQPDLQVIQEETIVDTSSFSTFVIANSLPWDREQAVSFRVSDTSFTLRDSHGTEIPFQVIASSSVAAVAFIAYLPPLGMATFSVEPTLIQASSTAALTLIQMTSTTPNFQIGNDQLVLEFNGTTGLLASVTNLLSNTQMSLEQQLAAYVNGTGGAYILFESQAAEPLPNPDSVEVYRGAVYDEVCQTFAYDANQVCIRVYQTSDPFTGAAIEVLCSLGPLEFNHELVVRFTTDLDTNGSFYIDESALEMHERVYNDSLTLAGNYHALIASTYICDNTSDLASGRELAVVSDHTMGVVSLEEGQLEILLLRRTNSSDSQGPYPLDDTSHVNTPLLLVPGTIEDSEAVRPRLILQQQYPPILFHSRISFDEWRRQYRSEFTALVHELPPNVDLMSLSVRDASLVEGLDAEYFLRLRHMFEVGQHPILSQPATVDLANLFVDFGLGDLTQTTLSLQTSLADLHRRFWPTAEIKASEGTPSVASGPIVTLGPVEMPTFIFVAK